MLKPKPICLLGSEAIPRTLTEAPRGVHLVCWTQFMVAVVKELLKMSILAT